MLFWTACASCVTTARTGAVLKITHSFSCIMMVCSVCAVSEGVSGDAGGLCVRSLVSPSSSLLVNDCVYHYTFRFDLTSHARV